MVTIAMPRLPYPKIKQLNEEEGFSSPTDLIV